MDSADGTGRHEEVPEDRLRQQVVAEHGDEADGGARQDRAARHPAGLTSANQNSNSPSFADADRLVTVSSAVIASAHTPLRAADEFARISAPAGASTGITSTQNHQYSKPTQKPAHRPQRARRLLTRARPPKFT
jgi:hypothetical protein